MAATAVSVVTLGSCLAVAAPATAVPGSLSVTPTHPDAGYFTVAGECPARTGRLEYRWTGGRARVSRTRVRLGAGPFSQLVHVPAGQAGGAVEVTVRCQTASGRTTAVFAPLSLVSGNGTIPFAVTAIDESAGYFLAQGECPKGTGRIEYRWTGAANGEGYGHIAADAGPFAEKLRMLATAPGALIEATITCQTRFGRARATFGPFSLTSGAAMLGVPADSGTGRRIVYSVSAQQVWAVEADDTVARTHLVSGRRLHLIRKRSQLGVFAVGYMKPYSCAGNICPNFIAFHREVTGWIGFHEIPRKGRRVFQKTEDLGQPRSAGCVRQSAEDAAWLYQWTTLGDTVVVVP